VDIGRENETFEPVRVREARRFDESRELGRAGIVAALAT
jgi:hypothetical protein